MTYSMKAFLADESATAVLEYAVGASLTSVFLMGVVLILTGGTGGIKGFDGTNPTAAIGGLTGTVNDLHTNLTADQLKGY